MAGLCQLKRERDHALRRESSVLLWRALTSVAKGPGELLMALSDYLKSGVTLRILSG